MEMKGVFGVQPSLEALVQKEVDKKKSLSCWRKGRTGKRGSVGWRLTSDKTMAYGVPTGFPCMGTGNG